MVWNVTTLGHFPQKEFGCSLTFPVNTDSSSDCLISKPEIKTCFVSQTILTLLASCHWFHGAMTFCIMTLNITTLDKNNTHINSIQLKFWVWPFMISVIIMGVIIKSVMVPIQQPFRHQKHGPCTRGLYYIFL